MKKASLLGISIIILLQDCFAPGISPGTGDGKHTNSETVLPSKATSIETSPTQTEIAIYPTSTPSPTSAPPTVQSSPSPTFELSNPQMYIGIEIPPLPSGFVEVFGSTRINGEAPPTWVNYHIFEIRAGNTKMLWLGKPIMGTRGMPTGKVVITDIIEIPIIGENEELTPFHCRRFGVDRWAIVAIIDLVNGDYSEYDYIDDITQAWIINQSDSKFIPITSEGVDCRMYSYSHRPILDGYIVEEGKETCP